MGISDNLFQRKDAIYRQKNAPHSVGGGSQQFRLNKFKSRGSGEKHVSLPVHSYVLHQETVVSSSIPNSEMTFTPNYSESGLGYPVCICSRSACTISCLNLHCNWSGMGRVRSCCPCHPTVTFLLDLPQCPECCGPLKENPGRQQDDSDDDL